MTPNPILLRAALVAALLSLLTGCNTTAMTPAKATEAKGGDDYVAVDPEIGSRIRKRVKKSELTQEQRQRSSQQKTFSAEALQDVRPDTAATAEQTMGNGAP